jgi:2-amino-4-hydroxy-6-hydroxymethyldihydropteridine diphosphokinase
MTESARRFLLQLGSNSDAAPERLDAALAALAALGVVQSRGPAVCSADVDGRGPAYLNRLVELAGAHEPAGLVAALKAIERRLGRGDVALNGGVCEIDIDLLAWGDGARVTWVRDLGALPAEGLRGQLGEWAPGG